MKQKDGSHKEAALVYQRSSATATPETSEILSTFQLDEKPIPLMLLGAYHMGNPNLDKFNVEADDALAPKRQAEIEEVVKKLYRFSTN
ncbi:MAG: hypothetical protein H6559_33330 [Lewinellaceae bacterium]|nr:hypothetical protein [Lewinellaceae bacterium]